MIQRFVNNVDLVVDDMLRGYQKAHDNLVEISDLNERVVKVKLPMANKVGLVSGGGSGHEPAFLGYVGPGLLDSVAVGEIFSSPTAPTFYDAFIEADQGAGVACLFGNYAGDNMNVKMAINMAKGKNIKYVLAKDDIASSPKETKDKRHGIAGGPFMWKIAGAKASLGGDLDSVINTAQKVSNNTRSLCTGLSPCAIPAVGQPNFDIPDNTLALGIGHHGEPSIHNETLTEASVIAKKMVDLILDDFGHLDNQSVAVMVSGLGSTPIMELYLFYDSVVNELAQQNIKVQKSYVGNFVTSLDMNGICLTVLLLDDELYQLLNHPAKSAGLTVC